MTVENILALRKSYINNKYEIMLQIEIITNVLKSFAEQNKVDLKLNENINEHQEYLKYLKSRSKKFTNDSEVDQQTNQFIEEKLKHESI